MNRIQIIRELRNNRKIFQELMNSFPEESLKFRPGPDKWNILEIACHLLDEERLDFRARMRHITENVEKEMIPIDPAGWVKSHKYEERMYRTVVDDFLNERDASVEWLESLSDEDLTKQFEHKVFGKVTAGDFLVNWLAHDYLHFRQITTVKYQYLRNQSNKNLDYAGEW